MSPDPVEDPVSVYVTTANADEADAIARALVGERLVACVNVLPGVRSVYWWDGEVQADGEVALIAKTRVAKLDAAIARIKALHSYDCPCVVAWPIVGGNPDYLDWIVKETP